MAGGELLGLVHAAMAERGWREADLVRATGLQQSRVNRFLRGAVREVAPDVLAAVAAALGLPREAAADAHARDVRAAVLGGAAAAAAGGPGGGPRVLPFRAADRADRGRPPGGPGGGPTLADVVARLDALEGRLAALETGRAGPYSQNDDWGTSRPMRGAAVPIGSRAGARPRRLRGRSESWERARAARRRGGFPR
jgi:DNA-binding Xre family transcriptional regulator